MLFQNICNDASRVQDCWNLAKTRVRKKINMPCTKMLHILIASVIHAWCKKSRTEIDVLSSKVLAVADPDTGAGIYENVLPCLMLRGLLFNSIQKFRENNSQ